MPTPLRALVVVPSDSGRRSVTRLLSALGLEVVAVREPYEATARFVEAPTDLVVLSLADFRPRDTAFLRTVRRRAPAARVLLLVPEGRRELARRAIETGADVWLPEPWHPEELTSFVRCLLPMPTDLANLGAESTEALRLLSGEISHAINNPLQVVRLLAEQKLTAKARKDALEHSGRIEHVVRIVKGFGDLGTPKLVEARLGTLVRESVEDAKGRGDLEIVSPPPKDGVRLPLDPQQIRYALDVLIDFLTAVRADSPLRLKVAVHRVGRHGGRRRAPPVRAGQAGPFIEAAFKARGLALGEDALTAYRAQVLCSHDESRHPYPGLAPVALVARKHGGHFVTRQGAGGTVFGLNLPLP